jgi:pyrimidine-nucleoside phosphorylase
MEPASGAGSDPAVNGVAPDGADGYVADLDALAIGHAAVDLGAGRRTKEDTVDPVAGLSDLKKPGDRVTPGGVLARLHTSRSPDLDAVRKAVQEAYTFSEAPPESPSPVKARYAASGWADG